MEKFLKKCTNSPLMKEKISVFSTHYRREGNCLKLLGEDNIKALKSTLLLKGNQKEFT